ncbi:hypothetical protein [Salsipaludibacter albus]|uniref:hypothetical protein n=1 Tax=Salsipaludibacter albus TaxID=2849650 RepID=UPI001EE3CBDB|nr:hypothetical protein [Salsipaludibacter albus]MBY5163264.1 hypothetical protein [Salsipaludibacter albus]
MTAIAEADEDSDLSRRRTVATPRRDDALWTFADRDGAAHCLLGYTVLGTDRRIGRVTAVVYPAGRARLEVTVRRRPATGVRTIPAGVVATIDHAAQLVLLNLPRAHVEQAPRGVLAPDGDPGRGVLGAGLRDHYRDHLHRPTWPARS